MKDKSIDKQKKKGGKKIRKRRYRSTFDEPIGAIKDRKFIKGRKLA